MSRKTLPCSQAFTAGLCAESDRCNPCPTILVIQQAELRYCLIVNVEIHSSCVLPFMFSLSRSVFYSVLLTATIHGLITFLMYLTFTSYVIFLCFVKPHNSKIVNEFNVVCTVHHVSVCR